MMLADKQRIYGTRAWGGGAGEGNLSEGLSMELSENIYYI
jgi:hypothetical protein